MRHLRYRVAFRLRDTRILGVDLFGTGERISLNDLIELVMLKEVKVTRHQRRLAAHRVNLDILRVERAGLKGAVVFSGVLVLEACATANWLHCRVVQQSSKALGTHGTGGRVFILFRGSKRAFA